MLGGGVGMSVENRYVSKLPKVKKGVTIEHRGTNDADFIVPDSREGWCELTRRVLESFFVTGRSFTYSTVCLRGYGEPIKSFGGTASGPIPLIGFIEKLSGILRSREGRSVRPIDAADMICVTGEMVVAGNVRRSAIIVLGDPYDKFYLTAKRWSLGTIPTYRAFANFSVVVDDVEDLHPAFWRTYEDGEPFGIVNRANMQKYGRMGELRPDKAIGCNPCGEISLENGEPCNLVELPLMNLSDVHEMEEAARLLFRYGKRVTMEDYHNPISHAVIHRNRRVGVGITGALASPLFAPSTLDRVYAAIQEEDANYSKELGVSKSIRTTTVKPSGCRPWYALTTTDEGILTLEELFEDHPNGQEWADFKKPTNVWQDGWQPITKTYVNGVAPVYRINMQFGLSVESTGNHPWFVKSHHRGAGRYDARNEFVATDQIQAGDVLEVNLTTYNKSTAAPLKSLKSVALHMRNDHTSIQQPTEMNSDLAWLFGYLWGDGAQSTGKYRIRWVDRHEPNLLKAERILREQFNITTTHVALKDRNASSLEIASKMLWHWLILNDVWKYQMDGSIDILPRVVRSSAKEHIIAFIAGLLDSDGAVSSGSIKTALDKTFTITTASQTFARHLQSIAWTVGIGIGCSHNTVGQNYQCVAVGSDEVHSSSNQKSMYLMTMATASDHDSIMIMEQHSMKMRDYRPDLPWRSSKSPRGRIVGKVESVECIGEMPTFDIETAGDHWYYAGAVKSHNTVSKLLDQQGYEGIHPAFSRYIIQRVRFAANDPLIPVLRAAGHYMEPVVRFDGTLDQQTLVADFYVQAPDNMPVADEDWDTWKQLDVVKMAQKHWSDNSVSVTVYYKKEEIPALKTWLEENLQYIKTISFLCASDHGFKQAPKEKISKEQFHRLSNKVKPIDFDQISEGEMESQECVAGACPIR